MIKDRMKKVRALMKKNKLAAYIIPSTDAHGSEYVPALWQRRAWLSGFDGSAGDVVITADKAGLWTDSRYFLQAEQQLVDSGIELYEIGLPDTPDMVQFLKRELKSGQVVGIDPRLQAHNEALEMQKNLAAKGIEVKYPEENLIDLIWDDQPGFPDEDIVVWDEKYAGESVASKLQRIRGRMEEEGADVHVLTMLDAIAWTFNLRSSDVEFLPVVIAYAIITPDRAELFCERKKVTRKVRRALKKKVKIYDYEDFRKRLLKHAKRKSRVWLDGGSVSQWVVNLVTRKKAQIIYKETPVTLFKAMKNETELAGIRASHVRDGVAMVKFLYWLQKEAPAGSVTEISAAEKLSALRAEQKLFQGLSFETISAYNEHAAIVHYTSSKESDVTLREPGIYLIDSGGQYLDGTTDITRTIALGQASAEQKDCFTRVLQGHIDLMTSSFPRGTQGIQLDTLARKALWDIGLNYGHGTGHGVGAYLGVHEGPQGISYYRGIGVPLELGMLNSNEPGFYKAGEYGMRIENLMYVVKDEDKSGDEFEFYKFENVTLCPIDLNLVDEEMLTDEQADYLNAYHKEVFDKLSPHLKGEELKWLEETTREI